MKLYFPLVFLLMLNASCGIEIDNEPSHNECGYYFDYEGVATIISIESSQREINSCLDPMEVVYHFIPNDKNVKTRCSSQGYLLNDFVAQPSRAWVKAQNIRVGSKYLMRLRSGYISYTCTPCMAHFPTLDTGSELSCLPLF